MSRDTNFYYSFLVLPAAKREAIIAVWDFCRAVDDAADREGSQARAATALARWRNELANCFDASDPTTSEGRRLVPFVRRFGLPRRAFEELIDGVELDVTPRRYESFEELREYCRRVASTVGLICIEIFGYQNPRAREYAVELGLALQLTNILRDVGSDLQRNRLYIPLQDLGRFGCTEANLREAAARGGALPENVQRLLAFQAARARDQYARARATMPREDARRLVAAEIMAAIYEAMLERIERSGYDVFTRKIRIPRPRRALIAASTWIRTMVAYGF